MSEGKVSDSSVTDPENEVPIDFVERSESGPGEDQVENAVVAELSVEDELAQAKDQLLRVTAEFQNYRRRTEQSRIQDTGLGKSIVLQQLLSVFDDLGRSLDAAKDLAGNQDVDLRSSYEGLRSGVKLVYKNFSDELMRLGLTEINAVGQQFDESLHEAMMQQPAEEGVEPGTVISEVQKGYMFGDRVLRHSKVIVAQ